MSEFKSAEESNPEEVDLAQQTLKPFGKYPEQEQGD